MKNPQAQLRLSEQSDIAPGRPDEGGNEPGRGAPVEAAARPRSAEPLRVLLVSANRALATRLGKELAGSREVALIVGHAPDVRTPLARLANGSKAAVVLADASLVEKGSIDPAPNVDRGPELMLVFDRLDREALDTVRHSRARGCIESSAAAAVFVRAAHSVVEGELWLPRWMLEIVYDHALAERPGKARPAGDGAAAEALTERESQVLRLIRRGLTNKEVAHHLRISASTVKKHVHNALAKRGLFRRRQFYG